MRRLRTWVALLASCCFASSSLQAQSQAALPIGSLRATGEVYVNNSPASGEQTLFAGDTVRTGATGNAAVLIPSRGTLLVSPTTRITFPATARAFAALAQGAIAIRVSPDAKLQIDVGHSLVVTVPEGESVAAIERAADGAVKVSCEAGSVGIIQVDGPRSVFLRAGQSLQLTPDGRVRQEETPPSTPPSEQPPTQAGTKKSKTPLIILLVAAGAGGGAAAALAGRGQESGPVSPFRP